MYKTTCLSRGRQRRALDFGLLLSPLLLSSRCFIGYNLKSEPVIERFRYSLPSPHVTGTFYPFAVHRGCPGVRGVLAVRFPLSGESHVVCATASNFPGLTPTPRASLPVPPAVGKLFPSTDRIVSCWGNCCERRHSF